MNLLDAAILIVFGLFVLNGWKNGFLVSLLHTGGFFLSWLCAVLFSPGVARGLFSESSFINSMLYYTEGAEMVKSVELRHLAVNQLSADGLSSILTDAALPVPLDTLVSKNMAGEVFAGGGISTVGEYFNQTIVCFTINVISFLLVFLVVRLLFTFLLNAVDYTVRLPMLKHFDGPLGAGFGFVRGFFAVFVLFMVVPTVLVVIPIPQVHKLIDESFFGKFFLESNFLLSFIKGAI